MGGIHEECAGSHVSEGKGKVLYFVGCVASFFPLVQRIPQAFVQILDKGEVDFATLGGEEWCCGFPLIQMGMPDKMQKLIDHNQEKVRQLGARRSSSLVLRAITTWKEKYKINAEMLHSSSSWRD